MKKLVKTLGGPFLAVICAVIVGSIVLLASGLNPLKAYPALVYGAFGNMSYFGDTLARATPIIFSGLAISISFKMDMFNIGAEGQVLIGAVAAAVAGHYFSGLPGPLHIILTIVVALAVAAIWGLIPGALKAIKGVHEVIATIMMNYIALYLGGYVVESMRVGDMAQTPIIAQTAWFPKLSTIIPAFESSNVNFGFILAIVMAIVMYFVLNKTVFGYNVKALGLNKHAAEDGGVNSKKMIIIVMIISAMLAALGGIERVLGVHHSYMSGISTNLGFEGIAVALLANNNPIGIIFSALLFGALTSGGQFMNFAADVPIDIVGIVQGLIILFVAGKKAFDFLLNRPSKREVA